MTKAPPIPSFDIGDLVRLKSGGPKMTVERVGLQFEDKSTGVRCVWFCHPSNCYKRDTFLAHAIQHDDRPGYCAG